MESKQLTSCPELYGDILEACGALDVSFRELASTLANIAADEKENDANNIDAHRKLCGELHELYAAKNLDYGDAFHITFEEEGPAAGRVRLTDKLERFKTLTKRDGEAYVSDESIRDTLLDLANYALMTVMELDRWKEAS